MAVVNYLNLDNLKLAEPGKEQILRTKLNVNMRGNNFDDLEGSLLISDTYYHFDKTLFYVHNIGINSFGFGKGRTFYLRSDFADGEVSGLIDAKHFTASVKEFMSHYLPDAYLTKDLTIYNQNAAFIFTIKNSDLITQLFAPDFHAETGTELSGRFNTSENIFSLHVNAPEIRYGNIRLNDVNILVENDSSQLSTSFKTNNISIGEGINIAMVSINSSTRNNRVQFQFSASDADTFPNRINLQGVYSILSPSKSKLIFEKSSVFITNEEWVLNRENNIDIDSSTVVDLTQKDIKKF